MLLHLPPDVCFIFSLTCSAASTEDGHWRGRTLPSCAPFNCSPICPTAISSPRRRPIPHLYQYRPASISKATTGLGRLLLWCANTYTPSTLLHSTLEASLTCDLPQQIGKPVQNVRVLPSTATYSTWLIDAANACPSFLGDDCSNSRGGLYNNNRSLTWVPESVC